MINYRAFTMPGKQRLSWNFNNYRQSLCVAADQDIEMVLIQCGSSPRTRRYFLITTRSTPYCCLFSAHAEVFPYRRTRGLSLWTLLRARGGISRSVGHLLLR